jgi:hypothetical protein
MKKLIDGELEKEYKRGNKRNREVRFTNIFQNIILIQNNFKVCYHYSFSLI